MLNMINLHLQLWPILPFKYDQYSPSNMSNFHLQIWSIFTFKYDHSPPSNMTHLHLHLQIWPISTFKYDQSSPSNMTNLHLQILSIFTFRYDKSSLQIWPIFPSNMLNNDQSPPSMHYFSYDSKLQCNRLLSYNSWYAN